MKNLFLTSFLLILTVSLSQAQLAKLLDNNYNKQGLEVGSFNNVLPILKNYKVMKQHDLLKVVENKNITLYEAGYALYFLGLTYIHDGKVQEGMKYIMVSANDYLNPVALVELSRLYYHGDEELHHIFPKEHLDNVKLDIEKDLEKSFVTLNLAFEISHHIHKKHGSMEILKWVSGEGVELLERFTFKNEADGLKDTEEHKTKLTEDLKHDLELLEQYKKMYTS